MAAEKTLIVACGALAREIVSVIKANTWPSLTLTCLPAAWHNRPELIPDGVRRKIREGRKAGFDRIFVAYGDCGTGGLLDKVLEEEGASRIGGDHCYAFYRGVEAFDAAHDADPTCFYLTDYLARHFQRLIIEGLWLDRHPDLLPTYFGHYSKLVYLAQTEDPALDRLAEAAAEHLGLAYERLATGMGELDSFLRQAAA
ncbi:MAG: DUF1638 domain-containing protein [Rhodospirillales bacterium]|nr:DUF1638 domain-containing protein [Rhodospirillales bacterium]